MWPCDAIGQTYIIQTKEIQYTELPPVDDLQRGTTGYGPRPDEIQRQRRYKANDPLLNLTITALSCVPRVFEILNFLSDVEINHILSIAKQSELQKSATAASRSNTEATATDETTRTSRNSWISRQQDIIIDTIHRRAADALHIHEALLRWRRPSEIPEYNENKISTAERLQLVHYSQGQRKFTSLKCVEKGSHIEFFFAFHCLCLFL